MSFLQLVLSLDKTIRDLILFCRQCHSDPYRNRMHSCLKFKFTKKFPSFIVRPRIKLVDQLFHKIDLIKELHSLLKLIFLCPTVCLVRKVNSGTNLLLKTSGLNIPKGSFNEQQYRMLCSYYFLFRKNETFTCVNVAVKEITP